MALEKSPETRPEFITELDVRDPFQQWQVVDVQFPSTANTDLVIRHKLQVSQPHDIHFRVIKQFTGGAVYESTQAGTKAWTSDYIVLRSDFAGWTGRILLGTLKSKPFDTTNYTIPDTSDGGGGGGGGTDAPGTDGDVPFNVADAFAADTGIFTYDPTNHVLQVPNLIGHASAISGVFGESVLISSGKHTGTGGASDRSGNLTLITGNTAGNNRNGILTITTGTVSGVVEPLGNLIVIQPATPPNRSDINDGVKGAQIVITSGKGQQAGFFGTGGAGGDLPLTAGDGGDCTGTDGGNGGTIFLTPGNGGVGSGTTGKPGQVKIAGTIITTGTQPTPSGSSNSGQTGGALAGVITSGVTGTFTLTLTFPKAAPNGWNVWALNQNAGTVLPQTTSSTTSATFSGATTSGDVVRYMAIGY